MIKCEKCGTENPDTAKFCTSCGANLIDQAAEKESENVERFTTEVSDDESGKPWATFANIGYILGIISLAFCWFPYSLFYLGGTGMVFSCLGRWSKSNREKADKGFTMSLISIILNFVLTIIIIAVIAAKVTAEALNSY